MLRNRVWMAGIALVVSLLGLMTWFASAAAHRCDWYENLGYIHLIKGTVTPSQPELLDAHHWFATSMLAGCPVEPATYGLGHAYSRLGLESSAISAWRAGDEQEEYRRFLIGRAYEEMGRQAAARVEYSMLPRDAAAHFNGLALQAEKQGDYEEALRYFAVSRTINPSSAKNYYGAAFIYWRRLGDEARAAAMIRQALAVDESDSPDSGFYRGLLCYYRDDLDCAVAAWAAVIRQKPRPDAPFEVRHLAYEMLSVARAERSRLDASPLAVAGAR